VVAAAEPTDRCLSQLERVPAHLDVLEIATGQRRPWKELTPPDPAGVLSIGLILLSNDGQSYVYSYRRVIDDLYLVEGLR
jgi:hypothetical protein